MGFWIDLVFPKEDKLKPKQIKVIEDRQRAELAKVEAASDPKAYADAYEKLIEDESERLKSVEGRLGSALGLTSITATLLISGILALLNGTLADSSRFFRGVAGGAAVYLSLQIICSTLAAVRGLGRATWFRPGIDDLVNGSGEGPHTLARKRAVAACHRYQATDRTVNYKVTQMAIAHTAIRNFAGASVMIATIGFIALLVQPTGGATAKAIKKDPELQKLLRGPQGPAGPPGATAPSLPPVLHAAPSIPPQPAKPAAQNSSSTTKH